VPGAEASKVANPLQVVKHHRGRIFQKENPAFLFMSGATLIFEEK
jgi:hypothetical protein